MIQISNNPYGTTVRGIGQPSSDGHGAAGYHLSRAWQGNWRATFVAALASGHPDRYSGFTTWATPRFEVTSGAPIELGLDGEALVMDPPLRFSMRPEPVRTLPHHAIGYSPAARSLGWRDSLHELWGVARGHRSRFERQRSL